MPDAPPGYADVVRTHHARTTGYLLAVQRDCVAIRTEELRRVKRRLQAVEMADLATLEPRGSWLFAVLLCAGDDTRQVASWALRLPAIERDSVRFYYRPRVDLGKALAAWVEAGLGAPLAAEVRDFASFHKVFGRHLNDRIWLDRA